MPHCATALIGVLAAALAQPAAAPSIQSNDVEAFRAALPDADLEKMPAVERLQAIEEIRQIPLRYARCLGQKDSACFRSLFHPDLAYHYIDPVTHEQVQGAEAMVRMLRDKGPFNDRITTILHTHGSEVELLSPTRARAQWAADFRIYHTPERPEQATGLEMIPPGEERRVDTIFFQTYEKVGGAWKIKSNIHLDLRRDTRTSTTTVSNPFKGWQGP